MQPTALGDIHSWEMTHERVAREFPEWEVVPAGETANVEGYRGWWLWVDSEGRVASQSLSELRRAFTVGGGVVGWDVLARKDFEPRISWSLTPSKNYVAMVVRRRSSLLIGLGDPAGAYPRKEIWSECKHRYCGGDRCQVCAVFGWTTER